MKAWRLISLSWWRQKRPLWRNWDYLRWQYWNLLSLSTKMVQCVAFNRNIWSQRGVSMYLFPKDPKFRRIWIRNLRWDGFKVTKYSKLCAKHLTPDQFTTHPALAKRCGYKKLDLRPGAIPSLFDLPIEKVEKIPRTSTAFFKRRTIEVII